MSADTLQTRDHRQNVGNPWRHCSRDGHHQPHRHCRCNDNEPLYIRDMEIKIHVTCIGDQWFNYAKDKIKVNQLANKTYYWLNYAPIMSTYLLSTVWYCGVGHCPCSRNVSIIMFKQARSRLDTGQIFASQPSTSDIFLATFQPVSLPSQLRLYWKCIDTLSHFVLPFSGPSIAMTFKKNCFDIIKWLCQMQCFHFYFLVHNL